MTKPTARPGIFTIPPGAPFADALVAGLLARAGDDPLALADARILVPTRRAVRALSEAFLRRTGGRPMVLPAMVPLGDADEDDLLFNGGPSEFAADDFAVDEFSAGLPPAIGEIRRILLLARLVRAEPARHAAADQAVGLARELARLLDHVQTERLDFADLGKLVPEEFAEHWQRTLQFLKIVTENWPRALAEEKRLDAADRRNRLLAARAAAWRAAPPTGLVVAAGTTGTVPATADLLETILTLPGGIVVLPGLDRVLDDQAWDLLEPLHPQYGMAKLLKRLGLARGDVPDWSGFGPGAGVALPSPHRARLAAAALRPAASGPAPASIHARALDGVTRIDCPTPHEEAGTIALIMRQALQDPDRTAALITPDRALARRVAAELGRFDIKVDDSAGRPLDQTPPGVFLRLLARAAAENFVPVPLLALLKHPLAAGGMNPGDFRARVRALELAALRGPRPGPGLEGLAAAGGPEVGDVVAVLERALGGFADLASRPKVALADLAAAHIAAAEALAVTEQDKPETSRLWTGEAGETAAGFAAELVQAADAIGEIEGGAYPALLESLMAGRAVHPRHGLHPRLHIWGLLEARLQHADILVLGGLNEGTWPPEATASPWMSRPMMARFGLPAPERRIGLAAHDFVQAFCAPRVCLTRSARIEGAPTVPSRWLLRIENLVRKTECEAAFTDPENWTQWQALLDAPAAAVRLPRPEPRPPIAARPVKLSVTQIETWMRDPYAIYARHVLKLRPLDTLDAAPDAAGYGTIVHAALDSFIRECPPPALLPADAEAKLLARGREVFARVLDRPGVWAFWWPRFERIARWFVAAERARRAAGTAAAAVTEARGEITIPVSGGTFTLTATADRIDRDRSGALVLVDYKTGAVPSEREIAAGFAPQLPLEALIAEAGGFKDIGPGVVGRLEHWKLGGGDPAGTIIPVKAAPGDLIADARQGLGALIAAFADPNTAYESRPRPEQAPRFSDYEHLARVKEWAAGEGGEEP